MNTARIGLIALLSAAFAGCDTVKAPYGAQQDQVSPANYPQVVVEQALSPYVVISQPVVDKQLSGITHVSVPVRLKSDQGQFSRVQYRFTFFEKPGVPATAQSDWKYERLEPRNQTFFQGSSMDAAGDWRLEIRVAR